MDHGQVSKEDEEQVVEWREGEGIRAWTKEAHAAPGVCLEHLKKVMNKKTP